MRDGTCLAGIEQFSRGQGTTVMRGGVFAETVHNLSNRGLENELKIHSR